MAWSIPKRLSIIQLIVLLMACIVFLLATLGPCGSAALAEEDGPIENATVVGYLVLVIGLITIGGLERVFAWHSGLIVTLLAVRELDFQTRFTTGNTLKITYWTKGISSMQEKLVVGSLLLLVLYVIVRYLRYLPGLYKGLVRGHEYAYSLFVAIVFLPLSKVFDASIRILRDDMGFNLLEGFICIFKLIEEMIELGIPLALILSLLQYRNAV
jgi:hypothetical protein